MNNLFFSVSSYTYEQKIMIQYMLCTKMYIIVQKCRKVTKFCDANFFCDLKK